MGPLARSAIRRAGLSLVALAALGCGGADDEPLPPPQVDLLRQEPAASEVIYGERLERHLAALAEGDRARLVAAELQRLGYRPGGPDGSWFQRYDVPFRTVEASELELRRDAASVVLEPGRDFVAALGGQATNVRLGGRELVFVDRRLAVQPGALTGKLAVVLVPAGPAAARPAAPAARQPSGAAAPRGAEAAGGGSAASGEGGDAAGAAVTDLLRRAAGAGAAGVVLLPRYGSAEPLPEPVAAGRLAAGTGLPVALWLSEPAARGVLATLLETGLGYLPTLEGRTDLLPLPVGQVAGLVVTARDRRESHFNVVGLLPARDGGTDELVALVAPLGSGSDAGALAGDPRAQEAGLAQLLAIAAACQAVSDPPRRGLLVAAVDGTGDGVEGARHLLALAGEGQRFAAAVAIAGGNLWGPTEDVTFVGLQASPVARFVQGVAAGQGRRVAADPAPWRGLLLRSPAWAFLEAGAPAVLLEPGTALRAAPPPPAPQPGRSGGGASRAANPEAAGAAARPAASAEQLVDGLVEDARFTFRLVLELLETRGELPRVDPEQVKAMLRQPPPASAPTPVPTPGRPQRAAGAAPGPPQAASPLATSPAAGAPRAPAQPDAVAGDRPTAAPGSRPSPDPAAEAAQPGDDARGDQREAPSFLAPPVATVPPPPPAPVPAPREPPADEPSEPPASPEPEPRPTAPRDDDPGLSAPAAAGG